MYMLLYLLNVTDALFTLAILKAGGTEENFVMDYVLTNFGTGGFLFLKIFIVGVLIWILSTLEDQIKLVSYSVAVLNIVYSILVCWECYVVYNIIVDLYLSN